MAFFHNSQVFFGLFMIITVLSRITKACSLRILFCFFWDQICAIQIGFCNSDEPSPCWPRFFSSLLNDLTLHIPLRIPLMTSIVIICTGLVNVGEICCTKKYQSQGCRRKFGGSTEPPSSSFSQQVSGRSAASFNPLTFPADNLEWPNPLSYTNSHPLEASQPYAPSLPLARLAQATFRSSICFPIEGFH